MNSVYNTKKIVKKCLLMISLLISFLCPSFHIFAADAVYEFNYSGDYETFVVPRSGYYRLEAWGAQGGYRTNSEKGGKGGYTRGDVYLNRGDILYIYVGGNGKNHNGYNGGGQQPTLKTYGGGASDIRFVKGDWSDIDSLKSRLIVAGGGGTDGSASNKGGAGGLTGESTTGCGSGGVGATLSTGGANGGTFGKGGNGGTANAGYAGAGGGGWYGGGGAYPDRSADDDRGGGGGSSFTWNAKTTANVPAGYSVPSDYYLTNVAYTTGVRSGDGLVRITALKVDGITSIEINRGNVPIDFRYDLFVYNLTVDNDVENIRFNISTEEGYYLTQSNRDTDMTNSLSVSNIITLTDEETGLIQIYTVNVRKQNDYLEDRTSVSYGYGYTGNYEKFYVPATGIYTLETWGAQGGHRGSNNGGAGGYAKADMYLAKGEVLYIYVGGSGNTPSQDNTIRGWNGGGHTVGVYGAGGTFAETTNMYGGGASDIRYGGNTLYNRVIVAAGGGSVGCNTCAGAGAGLTSSGRGNGGAAASLNAGGANGGTFGKGGNGSIGNNGYGGAGGGGWYGGGGGGVDNSADDDRGGGGGSNFAFTSNNSKYVPSGYLVTDKNYLTDATLYNGNVTFKAPNGSNETGHHGDGYVRISPKLINGVSEVTINDGEVPIDFDYTVYEYHVSVLDSVDFINVKFQLNDGYSKIESYEGPYDITDLKQYVYSVQVINDITGVTVTYTIHFHKQSDYLISGAVSSYGYSYMGIEEKFIAPAAGIYTLEAWGAQGASRGNNNGGKGGYSTGQIFLNKGQILYINVGGTNGYNGGGKHGLGTLYGGGASDIRINGESLYNRLLVAGGGGSVGCPKCDGGYGGGETGGTGQGSYGDGAQGATQTSGGANGGTFGQGGNGVGGSGGYGGGGGGGWYGGGGSGTDNSADDDRGGGGGSGFVWTSNKASIVPAGWLLSSNYYLTEAYTKAGNTSFLSPTGTTETGHSGNGFVKISFALSYDFEILVDDYVKLDKEFDYEEKEYTGTLDNYNYSTVNFTVTDSDSIMNVSGDGLQEIHVGDNTFNIAITYINGSVEVFTYHIYREANSIDYLNDIYIDGHSISEFSDVPFDKDNYTYNIELPYYMDEYDLTVNKGASDQEITNTGHIIRKENSYTIDIDVTNETKTSSHTYTLNITRPHTSKIKKLTFRSSGGSIVSVPIVPNQTVYDINLESHIAAIETLVELYDNDATYTVSGDGYILADKFKVIVEVNEPNVENTTYTINVSRITVSGYEKKLNYNGNVQTVVIPYDHEYLLQVWGAQGGNGGGHGGYSYGSIYLKKGTILYVYAGGSGASGGFNGGGTSRSGYGGGASDIRIGEDSLYSRVIVAGGGGGHGSDGCANGAVGGGTEGGGSTASGSCGTQAGGGTQTDGGAYGVYKSAIGYIGKFGIGANAPTSGGSYYGGGGGGGWYGGGSGATSGWSNGGGGGSGFIYTADTASVIESSKEWLLNSEYYLTNAQTLNGFNVFESPTGTNETGHVGNGAAKITIPYQENENNYLKGIVSNKGVITPEWDYNVDTYYLNLQSDEVEINIEGVPADGKASVIGNGDYIIEAGTTEIPLIVTAENGSTKTYTVVVTREADSNPNPKDILINGLLEQYCAVLDGACEYTFDQNTHEYNVKVPYTIREIVMVVDKAHYFQTVIGDGLYALESENNEFEISVTSENKKNTSKYKYNIYRDMQENADLKSLKLVEPEYELNYSFNITDYYITVPNETETVDVLAVPDDPKAKVQIEKPQQLDYGQNEIKITVTAQNGTQKIYTIFVTRMKNNNAFLKELTITDITDNRNVSLQPTPEFNKMNLKYNLEVENDVTNISLQGLLDDEQLATVDGFGEFELKVGINTFNIVVTAQDESILTYIINITRKSNANNLLQSLSVQEGNLTETFEPEKFVYYMYVTGEVEKLTINAVPQVETSTYTIIGNTKNLVAGKNEIIIRVKAENGVTCDYKIIVNRTGYDDNYLESLLVVDGNTTYLLTPNFDPLYETYTLDLPNNVTNVILTATANSSKRAKIGNNSVYIKNINLLNENPSNNVIVVTAEDGTTRTYTLTINREKSSDNTLQSLEVVDHEYLPDFDPEILDYNLETTEHSLTINAIPTNKFAKVEISNNAKNLQEGNNTITINVTNELGNTRTYNINVKRILSDDNTLKLLEIEDSILDPEFSPLYTEYNIDTYNIKLNINAVPNNKYASVRIEGNDSLKQGDNEIKIIVTSESGKELIYTIHANRIVDSNNYLSNLYVSTGLNEPFERETKEYSKTTEDEDISISVTLESKNATSKITDEEGNVISSFPTPLDMGENIFLINVTAQNGEVATYKLTITRVKHSDSKLSNLTTSEGLNEQFDPELRSYTVDTQEHELVITPTVREKHATYKIYDINGEVLSNNVQLQTGYNSFLIEVTAEDETKTVYSLTVNRTPKNIATIEDLGIEVEPKFDKNRFDYTITTDESSLNLDNIVLTDPYSQVTITGNGNFSNTDVNIVEIVVTSEDGQVQNKYTIQVKKEVSTDTRLEILQLDNSIFIPEFDKDINSYEAYLPNGTVSSMLKVSTLKNTAVIESIMVGNEEFIYEEFNKYEDNITFDSIDNVNLTIIVRAENGDRKTYTVNINSDDLINTYLKTLEVDCGTLEPEFDKDVNSYVVFVNEATTCNVSATSEVETSQVIGNENYDFDLNSKYLVITVKVTSAKGFTREYEVKLRRNYSNESRLKNLELKGYVLEPQFSSDEKEYFVQVENDVTVLNKDSFVYETIDPDSKVDFPELKLKTGDNTYTITSTSEDGTSTTTYTIHVTRKKSSDTFIPSVSIDANGNKFTCKIDPIDKSCDITVPSETSKFMLTADIPYGATLQPANPSSHILQDNEMDVKLNVTAEDGISNDEYTVHVIRGKSSNNDLLDLQVNYVSLPDFSPSKLNYEKTVLGTLSQVIITATLKDPKAKILTDLDQIFTLEYGPNNIEIQVEAEDGSIKTYTINIIRSNNDDATLTDLSVKNYPFIEKFDPEETKYTIRVPRSKTKLTRNEIIYTLSDPNAVISMDNELNIDFTKQYNIFTVTVTASNGVNQKSYQISVLPEQSKNNDVDYIVIDEKQVKPVNNEFNYDIFDTIDTATLTQIILKDEYATYDAVLPKTINYNDPYQFTVTAENGDVKVYTINLIKSKTRELKLLNIETEFDESFDCEGICTFDKVFNEDISEYEIYVPNNVRSLDLTVTLKNDNQRYSIIGNSDFNVGKNQVIVRVKNSLDETFDYVINVYREANSDAHLSGLSFTKPSYEITDFDENLYEYNVEFNAIDSADYEIKASKKNDGQIVTVKGANVLYYGKNDIIVHVQSESCFESVKTRAGCNELDYVIHAYRNEAYSNLLSALTISSGDVGDYLQVFNKYRFDYIIEVESEVSSVKIEGVAVDTEHTTVIGNQQYDLKIGLNTFYIVVEPIIGQPATYTINIIRKQNDNVNLENLEVVGYTLSPEFSKNVLDYYIDIDSTVNSLDIKYTKESPDETVYITGNSNFITGENIINVVVLSKDKTRGKTYRIHANRAASDNNLLNNIIVSSNKNGELKTYSLKPEFNSEDKEYTVNVPMDISEVNVEAVKGQVLQNISGDGLYAIDYGENDINISVTSESGIINNYLVKIIREFDFRLLDLTVSHDDTIFELQPNYTDGIFDYTLDVDYEIDSVNISASLAEISNDITGLGNHDLNTGNNDIVITVSYQDKGIQEYVIHINRKKCSDNTLSSLQVAEGVIEPIFDPQHLNYSVNIPYEYETATVLYETNSKSATVEVRGNTDLEVLKAKDIEVIVTAEDGTQRIYVITATRLEKPLASNKLVNMYIDEGTINPTFDEKVMNYSADVSKNTNRITLHLLAEEPLYTTVEVYKLGTSNVFTLDMKVVDPHVLLDVQSGKNTFIIRVTNYEGSIRNYQLDIYRSGESEARIKSLSFNHGTLQPIFDRNINSYTMEVEPDVTSIEESIIMMDPNATYTITGNKSLKKGENTIVITTLAQDGKTSLQYTIIVNKKSSNNAYLSDIITFPEKDFTFQKDKYNYILHVDDSVNRVQIIGIREDTSATLTGNGIYDLTGEDLTINLTVVAEDGTTRIYTVVVKKSKDDNAKLRELTVNNGSLVPEFDGDLVEYDVEVENYVEDITINGIAESSKAKVEGNGTYKLDVGKNKFSITVTAEDGTIKTYYVTVTRKENEENFSKLKNLKVIEGELIPKFNPLTLDYVVNIPNEYENVTVIYETYSDEATVKINGATELEVGHNEVQVIVSYHDETVTYKIDVIRQEISNTYLNVLSVDNYDITPQFEKTVQEYTLNVENNVETITVKATPELETSKVYIKSDSDYELCELDANINLKLGINEIYIKVVSSSNAERVYKLTVTRINSDDNKLLTLNSDVGEISPKFDPNENEYILTVPEGTESVTLSGTVSDYATVKGLQTYQVYIGSKTQYIYVTSQSGVVNVYEITIVRNASHDASIINIVPSTGSLNPTFQQDISKYNMEVEGEINSISFDVITSYKNATVTGNNLTSLFPGTNIITITVTAEDGITQQEVIIEVYKKTDIISFETQGEISIPVGADYQIEIKYNPETTDYKEMEYEVISSPILSVSSIGLITPTEVGDTKIKITSKRNKQLTKTITVHVINPLIETDVYIINREDGYVTGMEVNTTIEDFINNFKNEKETLKVYEQTQTEEVSDIVKTKYVIQLSINDHIYDELVLVLKGDINGDGFVTVNDVTKVKNYVLSKETYDVYEQAAADVDANDILTVNDVTKIKNYVLSLNESLNTDIYSKKELD